MPNPYLLIGLAAAPLTIQRIVRLVPPDRWDDRTDPMRFSLRESVAHLADWEHILLERMRTAVVAPGDTILAYDESLRAEQMGYRSTDPVEQCEVLIDRRAVTVRYLRELPDGVWANQVVHPERGPLTLTDLANLVLGHDLYHLEHLSQFLPKVPDKRTDDHPRTQNS